MSSVDGLVGSYAA